MSLAKTDCKGGQNSHVDRAKRVETSWGNCKSKFNSFTQRPCRFRTQPVRREETPTRFLHKKSGKQSGAFVPLQRETQCLWQKLIAKAAKSVGRNDRLWHPKSPCLPKAPSQSPRIQLTLNSEADCRFHWRKKHGKAETGVLSKNSALQNSWVLAQGSCTRDGCSGAKTPLP